MALTIKQLTNYSWMSQASYLDFSGFSSGTLSDDLESRLIDDERINAHNVFTADQAEAFTGSNTSDPTDGFSFVSYAPNYLDTGFSATVFKSNADNSYTIAVRGTEPPPGANLDDLVNADALGVVLQGKALEQLFVGYRYYKQLTATGSNASYSQQELTAMASLLVTANDKNQANADTGLTLLTPLFALAPVINLISTWTLSLTFSERVQSMAATLQTILNNDPTIGSGAIPAGATINFTGHSLGGHVAALLAEMVAQYGNSTIGDIATYNAPGINALSYVIQNWLTVGTATTQTGVLATRVAVVSDGGADVTAGLGQTNGIVQRTFIETSSNPISNHSIVKLSDSFAIKNVFATLDPTIAALDQATSVPQLDAFIKQSSNTLADSLEKTLDVLRKVILGESITPTVESGSEVVAARDSLYTNIQELTNSATFQSLIGKVTLIAPPTNANEAREDFGAFLSLYYLTPFALKTDGSAAAIAALGAIHPDLEDKWQADNALTPEQIANGEANFSDMYLVDRAAMLSWINKINEEDFVDPNNGFGYQDGRVQGLHFEDKSSNQVVDINKILTNKLSIIFGKNVADNLTGGDKTDHLFGMGGDDEVSGGDGNDYLEGNSGNDQLNGEKGKDILLGGDGSDTLTGGKDRDILYGGEGVDTYIHNQGDGSDVIMDTDGVIKAKYQGIDLTVNGGKRISAISNYWQSEDKKVGYAKYTDDKGMVTLNVFLPDGEKLYIPNWQAGDFGINLQGPDEEQPPTPPSALTDGDEYLFSTVDYSSVDGMGGNDVLFGTVNNDRILGGIGNDILGGFVGDDVLEGGDGNDWLEGGVGEVTLYGGSGDDFLTTAESFYENTPDGYVEVNGSYRLYKKNESGIYESFGADNPDDPGDYDRWETISALWQPKNVRQEGDDGLYFYTEFLNTYGTDVGIEAKLIFTDSNYEFRASYYQFVDDKKGDFFYGGAGNDTILGSMNSDYIEGGGDDDVIAAGSGADYIDGGTGDDQIAGHDGDDLIDAGDGNDRVYAGYDSDVIFGGDGDDEIIADIPQLNNEFVSGTAFDRMGDDTAYGGAGEDMLFGQGGDDTLFGGADNDHIRGDDKGLAGAYHGSDYLVGDEGDDVIYGDGGADTLKGGLGADH